jgi:hypothetical protein
VYIEANERIGKKCKKKIPICEKRDTLDTDSKEMDSTNKN